MRGMVILLASAALGIAGELHEAARVCDEGRLRKLLAGRPPLNEVDDAGRTPLHVAIDVRRKACVELLLVAGADRSVRDSEGRTPFEAASRIRDKQERAEIMLLFWHAGKSVQQESKGPKPWSLESAVTRGQSDVVRTMLGMGADPNEVGTTGTTPLADAALKGDHNSVRALLRYGARPGTVSPAGTQPIHDAALGDSEEVIRDLVAHGADVNARTRDEGQTPLHIAAVMGRLRSVETLVALGADVKAKDAQGRTPMEAAERAGLPEVAAILQRAAAKK